jgi:predicted phosphodiesterase
MPLAALYDIHGNLPALEAVLADVRAAGVDDIIVGGDVLPGPMPLECLALLRALDVPTLFIRGNGDRSVLEALAGAELASIPEAFRGPVRWNAEQLTTEDARWMATWPETVQVQVDPFGAVLFCHATPRDDNEIFSRRTAEELLLTVFQGVAAPLVVCGHTHMQFDRQVGPTRVVNAGSVGMPFGKAGAYWLLLDNGLELRRTPYDGVAAAERIRATAYPRADAFADGSILTPPAEEQMLAIFSRGELK